MKGKFLFAVGVCLFFAAALQAQTFLKIDEAAMRADFVGGRLQTSFPFENSAANFQGRVKLEILDDDDAVLAASETGQTVKRGRQILQTTINFTNPPDAENLIWKRLRYMIAPENSADSISGIVSLSEIMPEIFELQISAPEKVFAGMSLRAHVVATHPLTKKPIKNVVVSGEIALDTSDEKLKIEARGKTNDEGFATLDFQIPARAKLDDDGEITIKGEKNGFRRTAENDLDAASDSFVYINTDKPIYQPAQKLFVRGLYLNPLKRPLADAALEFEITDEDDETVYEKSVKTSRFGVAAVEWQIPANLKLGTYKIEVKNETDDVAAGAEFKVTRYDLPNFTISATPDKSFYLPEQKTAEIAVTAAYLFGKPVVAGKVRVAREKERRWNYEKQEYEIEEDRIYEGEIGADGKFTARVDLSEAQEILSKEQWKRFEDIKFAAYLTDTTTNRTEQKRFDVRLTKEPIHIYFIRPSSNANPQIPFAFYVSTFYADGSPARCDLQIKGFYENASATENLAAAKTNGYGAGKTEIRIPAKPFPEAKNTFNLQIFADDGKGNRAIFADNIDIDQNQPQIRVSTRKTVYLPNEAIEAEIFSSATDKNVFVEVLKNRSVVYSKRIRLKSNRAALLIPFLPDFKGELTVAAYYKDEDEDYGNPIAHAKTVIFPATSKLDFNLKSLKDVYRPNETARLSFGMRNAEQMPLEAAVGVVVLDKAIEERAAVEQLPDNFKNLRRLIGTSEQFGNLTRRDLDNLDLSKPIDADLQLAAEFLLVNKSYEPNFFASESYTENFAAIYKNSIAAKLESLEKTLIAHYEKTGEFPVDETSLRRILTANGADFEQYRDAWNLSLRPEFAVDRNFTILKLRTASADKKFDTEDDFTAKEMRFEWFAKTGTELAAELDKYARENEKKPQTEDEIKTIWRGANFDFDALRDGWNRPLYLDSIRYTRAAQKITPETVGTLDGEKQQVLRAKIVSQDLILFRIRSTGADAHRGGYDDFDLAAFPVVLSETDLSPKQTPATTVSKNRIPAVSGAVGGTLFDANGAVIPGAAVTAENQNSNEKFATLSNENGEFLLANLPSGKYKITAESTGFQRYVIENVVVTTMNLIKLEIYLEVGSISSTVDVTAAADMIIETSSASISKTVTKSEARSVAEALGKLKNSEISTPRVREYFPETLVWSPELVTGKNGRAELNFRLGDNLTTWKLYAVGSTETGEIGLIEREFQTFQPFFAELDPPKILTEGDEIALPVPVRNYTDKRQKVSVSMAPNDWSKLNGETSRQIEIAAHSSQNAVFNFRAVSPIENGKQKVSATAKKDADAIEKTVTVKPDGKEKIDAQSSFFRGSADFTVNFPLEARPQTRRTEIKIYPNMLTHVAESVTGLLKRPYGCGEQTTSSTYPNLLILKIEKQFGAPIDPQIKMQAQQFLADGYQRLLDYQTASGGFSYWGKTDTPNAALTAYVLRFLNDAKEFIEVDEIVIENARDWLLRQQKTDGSWQSGSSNAAVSTAYAARSLALVGGKDETIRRSLQHAIEYIRKQSAETNDDYVSANAALATIKSGDARAAREWIENLSGAALTANNSASWKTANTPFYGWGKAAEIETTALAVQALIEFQNSDLKFADEIQKSKIENLIARGTMFLLENKDKFGVWHSTQTTVNVLDALVAVQNRKNAETPAGGEKIEIFVNGAPAKELTITNESLKSPVIFDVSALTNQTVNRVEIKTGSNLNPAMAQIVSAYYVDWANEKPDARYFDLKVNFSKTEAKIGEEIVCEVSVKSKINSRRMILTEIGLPPGADVDRAALEKAKSEEKFSSFDVLPDKIIVYSWADPSAPTSFKFKFRPRFGLNAQTASFVVYDYYNEEAQMTAAPVRFSVK